MTTININSTEGLVDSLNELIQTRIERERLEYALIKRNNPDISQDHSEDKADETVAVTVEDNKVVDIKRDAPPPPPPASDTSDSEAVEEVASATPPPPPAPAADEEQTTEDVDAEGYPWDKRIHASSKAFVKDGTWRRRRGITEQKYEQVTAELQNQGYGPDNSAPTAGESFTETPVGTLATEQTASDVERRSYSELSTLVTDLFMSDRISSSTVEAVVKKSGFETIPDLEDSDPETIGKVYAEINASV